MLIGSHRVSIVLLTGLLAGDVVGQCELQWTTFPGGGANGNAPRASVVYDPDGDGPQPEVLVIGGTFVSAGGIDANKIAQLSGNVWSPLGDGLDNQVYCVAILDEDGDGPATPVLFAAGSFLHAGGKPANRIAMWDGGDWFPLGSGMDDVVVALAIYDDDGDGPNPPMLYAGGPFLFAGGVAASHIARWDGEAWSPVGAGFDANVGGLGVHDIDGDGPDPGLLMAGGDFTISAETELNHIAAWDGREWSPLGVGLDDSAIAFATFDEDGDGPLLPALFAGGSFFTAGEVSTRVIARWNGESWSDVGGGLLNGQVVALKVHDEDGDGPLPPALFAGGTVNDTPDGIEFCEIARWDGASWSAVGAAGVEQNEVVNTLTSFDRDGEGGEPAELFVAGSFDSADGAAVDRVAFWNGTSWLPIGEGPNGAIFTMTEVLDGDGVLPDGLYLGGVFEIVDEVHAESVAYFDGVDWHPLGGGVDGSVEALSVFDPDGAQGAKSPILVVGGAFISVEDDPSMQKVAAWDGAQWLSLGNGMTGGIGTTTVNALTVWDRDGDGPLAPELYAGGDFRKADGNNASFIARWTGTTWSNVAAGTDDQVTAMGVYDPDGPEGPEPSSLYVGGEFLEAGHIEARGIARWDGSSWHEVAGGIDDAGEHRVFAFATFDEDGRGPARPSLFVGGDFGTAGGLPFSNFARWDGKAWSEAAGGGANEWVHALRVFDIDGEGPLGPQLYVGGQFTNIGGGPVDYLGSWDGDQWSDLGEGVNGAVGSFAVFDPPNGQSGEMLYVGGGFTAVEGRSSQGIAGWSLGRPIGDLNGDCSVGPGDLIILLGAWGDCNDCEDCPADLDDDCVVGTGDLIILLGNWG